MEEHIYCDEIGQIMVTGAIVRFDLMIQSTTERDTSGKPRLVLQQRVVMPIDAFLRAAGRMQNSIQDMVKKGVIQRTGAKEGTKATAPSSKASEKK